LKKYSLIETNTKNLIAEFDDYLIDKDNAGNLIIEPRDPSIKEKQQHEDTMFWLREIYMRTDKLIKQNGIEEE